MATEAWELGYGYGTSGNWARYMLIGMACSAIVPQLMCSVQYSGDSREGVSPRFHEQVIILVPIAGKK